MKHLNQIPTPSVEGSRMELTENRSTITKKGQKLIQETKSLFLGQHAKPIILSYDIYICDSAVYDTLHTCVYVQWFQKQVSFFR